ncbi:hypothetical protein [Yoonia sp. 208BN28-4]|uniref:hypothetical protein n=1 Tax=Yoonia sp. 208BN28-4 TaxID=3126505 RepID=UPI0030A423D2
MAPVTKKALTLALTATLTLSACATISNSRFNPLNWFGPSTSVPVTATGEIRPLVDPATRFGEVETRNLIAAIESMRIERSPSGAIVRATGIAAAQGQYNAELVEAGQSGGVLTLAFRAAMPNNAQMGGPLATRRITVATELDFNDLDGVRTIRVQGAQNVLSSSR